MICKPRAVSDSSCYTIRHEQLARLTQLASCVSTLYGFCYMITIEIKSKSLICPNDDSFEQENVA